MAEPDVRDGGPPDPDSYRTLARAVYAEMALAGISTVGEFHYLHHDADGRPYADPNAMAHALVDAARGAGIRLTLLDTCYLRAGLDDAPLAGTQLRFGDGTAERMGRARRRPRRGRRRPRRRRDPFRARGATGQMAPSPSGPTATRRTLHVHSCEQTAEVEDCMAVHGCTPDRAAA